MSYFLTDKNLELHTQTTIDGDEAHHILLSRRMRVGDYIEAQSIDGRRFKVEIRGIKKNSVEITVVSELSVPEELSSHIILFQSVVSEKALDFIFQKATELGAYEIVLFNSQNTATKLTQEKFTSKLERWNRILWEAAKQSGRGVVPKLSFAQSLEDVVALGSKLGAFYVLDREGKKIDRKNEYSSIGFVVGPEGGLTKQEMEVFSRDPHAQIINISPFILRAETAAVAGLTLLQL